MLGFNRRLPPYSKADTSSQSLRIVRGLSKLQYSKAEFQSKTHRSYGARRISSVLLISNWTAGEPYQCFLPSKQPNNRATPMKENVPNIAFIGNFCLFYFICKHKVKTFSFVNLKIVIGCLNNKLKDSIIYQLEVTFQRSRTCQSLKTCLLHFQNLHVFVDLVQRNWDRYPLLSQIGVQWLKDCFVL